MRTIRITVTSPENTNVVLKECKPKPASIKEKLATLLRKLSVSRESENKT